MHMKNFKSKKELLEYARQAESLTFGNIDKNERLKNKRLKGGLGQIIEESYFGYEINSDKEADFKELGVELKVTPIRELKNGMISSKERLVLNIINYETEYKKDFFNSSFWEKSSELLIMFYLWREAWERKDYPIVKSILHSFNETDLQIIKQDWKKIVDKIKDGKAHELSEGDTNYLGAVTKGASSKSLRTQPFSNIKAKQRAFSLKQSYMTALVRELITDEDLSRATNEKTRKRNLKKYKSIINNRQILEHLNFDDYIISMFNNYIGFNRDYLIKLLNIKINVNKKPKHINYHIIRHILNVDGSNDKVLADEFEKANIVVKCVEYSYGKKPRESLKIQEINEFNEITDVKWEDSNLYKYLESTRFLFVIFEKTSCGTVILRKVKFWSMPTSDLNNIVKPAWEKEKQKLLSGVNLTYIPRNNSKGYIVKNNLIKQTDNKIIHIRPSAQVSQYSPPYRNKDTNRLMNNARKLPVSAKWINRPGNKTDELHDYWMTKQAFWLNNNYISKIIDS